MEFWGVEVKAGEPVKCEPGEKIIHLSQASLGEVKKDKGNDSIPIFVKVGDQKLVLGTLSPEKCAQIQFDLVFEREFELSHNWKHASVYFCGYRSVIQDEVEDFTESDSEEDIPVKPRENGKPVVKDEQAKPPLKAEPAAAKPKVQIVEPNKAKEEDDSDDSDEDDEGDSSDDESEEDEEMVTAGDDSDEDEEDEESSDEEEDETTPKKDEKGKKRAIELATKTPVQDKKAKLSTPVGLKPGGKKGGGHTATPHPSKHAGRIVADGDKSKQQTPKSGGQVSCKSCNRTFNSENALQSHTKAKHSGGK